jgi:hypothetical protein
MRLEDELRWRLRISRKHEEIESDVAANSILRSSACELETTESRRLRKGQETDPAMFSVTTEHTSLFSTEEVWAKIGEEVRTKRALPPFATKRQPA